MSLHGRVAALTDAELALVSLFLDNGATARTGNPDLLRVLDRAQIAVRLAVVDEAERRHLDPGVVAASLVEPLIMSEVNVLMERPEER